MAEILCALTESNRGNYVPFYEMLDPECREIYETVGEHLMMIYELGIGLSDKADFLVRLDDGQRIAFSCGIHETAV